MNRFFFAGGVVLLVTGCLAAQAASVSDFVRVPNIRGLELSPDGTHLAMIVPSEKSKGDYDKTELRVVNLAKNEVSAALSFPEQISVLDVDWVNVERLIVRAGKRMGGREGKSYDPNVIAVNRDGSKQETIFGPRAGTIVGRSSVAQSDYGSMSILSFLPAEPENVLIYKSEWGRTANSEKKPGITRLNVYNGKQTGFERIPFYDAGVVVDAKQVVRFATTTDENTVRHVHYRDTTDGEFREVARHALKETGWSPISIDPDDGTIYTLSNLGRDTLALAKWDPKTGAQTEVVADERSDIGSFYYAAPGNGGKLLAVRASRPDASWISLGHDTPELRALTMGLASFKGKNVGVVSRTWDGAKAVLAVSADTQPVEYYLADTAKKSLSMLSRSRPWLKQEDLQTTRVLDVKARDGLILPSLLTLPKSGEKNLPAVLLVHGGPFGVRDTKGYDSEVQLLAHHGYAVMQVNYRGSGGYGSNFEQAGYGQYGAAMQDDLVDATRWLIDQGVADAKRICIMGHSYGGYAAMWGVARDPELYRCAVASMGVYDLPLKYEEGECQENDKCRKTVEQMMGTDLSRLKAFSPVYHAEKVKAAVLLSHGEEDRRVPIEHAMRLKKAMDKAGKKYEWVEFDGEGHGFANPKNAERFYTQTLNFLNKHIGAGATSSAP